MSRRCWTIDDIRVINDLVVPQEQPYEFVLEGGGGLEDVPAGDVAAFIAGVVRLVSRAAGHVVGRPIKETGRRESIIEMASKVRLQSVQSGSVALMLLPAVHEPLPVRDSFELMAETVSERALTIVYETVEARSDDYPDVAAVWADVGERLGIGERYTGISVTPHDRAQATLDRPGIERLRATIQRAPRAVSRDLVSGVLYEADFEARTAKLRDPIGSSVSIAFEDDDADAIKEALRNRTTLVGHVTYDTKTGRVVSVRVEQVEKPVQLTTEEFWSVRSAEELIEEQGVGPVQDAESLRIEGVSDEEWAAFFEAVGVRR